MATETTDGETATEEDFVPFLGQFFPEALTLAALLAVLALLATVPFLGTVRQLELFSTGFFRLFTVQMPLILLWVLSATVVESSRMGRALDWVAEALPTGSQWTVVYATGVVALVFGWINWALGLIGAFYVGRKLCRRAEEDGTRVHYPAVLTAALLSLVITNVGLSSPGALLMADASGTTNFLVDPEQAEVVVDMSAFLLHPANVISSLLFVLTLPALLAALAPGEGERRPVSAYASVLQGSIAETLDFYSPPPRDEWVFADKLEQSRTIAVVTFLLGATSAAAYFATGGRLTMLWLLFVLMMTGILIHARPMAFADKVTDATRWANHVAIPFLLYAGAFALLLEAELYAPIGDAFAATGVTQAISYVVALALGLLVPSPGSLWVLQGPALVESGADLVPSVISVMYGAGVSNLWLGFLFVGVIAAVYGFDWREFVRYAAAVTAYVSVVVITLLVVF
ncbi:short-chain fatty acid transporter [Halostella sp. JP-L12]|uniref:TIGR00366 family protein n=1 Tax=Halostella TaxID=1843185 RepID=UPI000EF7A5E2|nr:MULTISPECIES: TIGR00366 family protein [Halostella]NHN48095.1 short-chain fatty acid transporter [Halostella sp. JP-L12]